MKRKTQVWICFLVEGDADSDNALSESAGRALEPQLQEDWTDGRAGSAHIFRVQRVPNEQMEATFA